MLSKSMAVKTKNYQTVQWLAQNWKQRRECLFPYSKTVNAKTFECHQVLNGSVCPVGKTRPDKAQITPVVSCSFRLHCCRRDAGRKKLCHLSMSGEISCTFIYSSTFLPTMPPTPLWQGDNSLYIFIDPLYLGASWMLALWVIPMFLKFPLH